MGTHKRWKYKLLVGIFLPIGFELFEFDRHQYMLDHKFNLQMYREKDFWSTEWLTHSTNRLHTMASKRKLVSTGTNSSYSLK